MLNLVMADVSVIGGNNAPNLDYKINFRCDKNIVTSDLKKTSKLLGVKDLLELKLDLEELQELFIMTIRPRVKDMMRSFMTELEKSNLSETVKPVKKGSCVVAGAGLWS